MFAVQHKLTGKCVRSIEYSSSGHLGITFLEPDDMQEGSKVHVFDTLDDAVRCINGNFQATFHDFCEFEIGSYGEKDYQVVCLTAVLV